MSDNIEEAEERDYECFVCKKFFRANEGWIRRGEDINDNKFYIFECDTCLSNSGGENN